MPRDAWTRTGLGAGWLLAVASLAASSLAACFVRADYGDTAFSCVEPPHECPDGYECVAGACRLGGGDAAPVVDAAEPDAAEIDATPDAVGADAADACDAELVVDGDPSETVWDGDWVSIAKLVGGVDAGVTAQIAARWSSTRLYVAWRVVDDSLTNDSVNPWQDDSVELYLDMELDRTTTYEADDFQYILGWDDAVIWEQADRFGGVVYAFVDTADGYTGELAIPWATLAAVPEIGAAFGFDAGYNFDQDGMDREGQLMWTGTADNWQDTSAFGTATLADACGVALTM